MHEVPKGKITCIEKCVLRGTRPRYIGFNARIPAHGAQIADPVVRVRTDGGAWGLGWSRIGEDEASGRCSARRSAISSNSPMAACPRAATSTCRCGIWWRG